MLICLYSVSGLALPAVVFLLMWDGSVTTASSASALSSVNRVNIGVTVCGDGTLDVFVASVWINPTALLT